MQPLSRSTLLALGLIFLPFGLAASGASQESSQLLRRIIGAARQGDMARLSALIGEIPSNPSPKLVETLLQLGVRVPSREVYRAVRAALKKISGPEAIELLGNTARKHRDWRYRILAIMALGDVSDISAAKWVIPLLKDKNLRIRMQAAQALGNKPTRESVDALVEVLPEADKKSPEFSLAVRRALFRLTGQNLVSADDWAKWWRTIRPGWRPVRFAGGGRTTVGDIKPPGNFPTFFGIEILSLRVVFVIDISGSMNEPVEGTNVPRIDLVKNELIRLIQGLKPKAWFTIVAFSDKIRPMSPRLVPATRTNKARAVRFVKGLKAGGYTWTQEALEKAFSYADANTIVLLSDGTPCKKNFPPIPTKPIVDWVAAVNRFRQVTIHCVGFRGAYAPFLRTLALENGGMYRHARPRS